MQRIEAVCTGPQLCVMPFFQRRRNVCQRGARGAGVAVCTGGADPEICRRQHCWRDEDCQEQQGQEVDCRRVLFHGIWGDGILADERADVNAGAGGETLLVNFRKCFG